MSKISKETYDFEINMCKELSIKEKWKCNWWECSKCWVLPLLHKLYESKLLEDKNDISEFKKRILN